MKQFLFRDCLNWFLSNKSKNIDKEGPWRVSMISEIISSYYSEFNLDKFKNKYLVDPKKIYNIDYNSEYLKPVADLSSDINQFLKNILSNALIHGSLSDLTYKRGWSDLDTFFIINRETCTDPKKLIFARKKILELTKYIYKIDLLSHHEFIFISEFDLLRYHSFFMPYEVLKNSKSLLNNPKKFFLFQNSIDESLLMKKRFKEKVNLFKNFVETGVLNHHPYKNKYLNSNLKKYNNRMYQLKYFLENIMILPAYYLEAVGKPTEKSKSFDIKDEFKLFWDIIDKSSSIRKKWTKLESFPYCSNDIPKWVIEILGNNYHKESYELILAMNDKISQ